MFAKHQEKDFFPAFFKVSIDHLFDKIKSGKINYCFGKKILKFGTKNLYEPWVPLSLLKVAITTKLSALANSEPQGMAPFLHEP